MQVDVENFEKDQTEIEALKREIESLRRQLKPNPSTTRPLSWDTELLVRKTQNLDSNNVVSCADPQWQGILEVMDIGRDGVRIDDVRTVEQIEFVAGFAARRDLAMTYGNRSFHLEPRHLPFDLD